MGELDVHQLLGVQRAMPVAAGSYWLGQQDPGRVRGLEDALQVDPPCNLTNEDRCHALGAQLLVHTEEVDFHHQLLAAAGGVGRE